MFSNIDLIEKISKIAESDKRYAKEGFLFVLASLEHAMVNLPVRRHLTGRELSIGIAGYAVEQYGYLAKTVLNNWGIYTTRDFGEIVYLMIEKKLMSKTEEDSVDDFNDVYKFEDEFSWGKVMPYNFPDRL
jgi:uncharacterized repeat protein (TIGR04138 family)